MNEIKTTYKATKNYRVLRMLANNIMSTYKNTCNTH